MAEPTLALGVGIRISASQQEMLDVEIWSKATPNDDGGWCLGGLALVVVRWVLVVRLVGCCCTVSG